MNGELLVDIGRAMFIFTLLGLAVGAFMGGDIFAVGGALLGAGVGLVVGLMTPRYKAKS